VVRVHFDVLVLDVPFLESDPDALDEGAEPARVELEGVFGFMGLGNCWLDVLSFGEAKSWLAFTVREAGPVASGWRSASGWSLLIIVVARPSLRRCDYMSCVENDFRELLCFKSGAYDTITYP